MLCACIHTLCGCIHMYIIMYMYLHLYIHLCTVNREIFILENFHAIFFVLNIFVHISRPYKNINFNNENLEYNVAYAYVCRMVGGSIECICGHHIYKRNNESTCWRGVGIPTMRWIDTQLL